MRVEASTRCREVERIFAFEPELSSVVVMIDDEPACLMSRRRFMMEMAGRIGYGRALHANRPILEIARQFSTLTLPPGLNLEEAGRLALERDSRWRYDDILVVGPGGCVCTATVAELFSSLAEENERRSLHDPMTGLANRAGFARSVASSLLRRHSPDCVAAVLFVDVDEFKSVNDTFGHAVGDAVLTELGGRLRGAFRDSDVVARLGGDEFAVLLPDTDETAADAAATRIVTIFAQPIEAAGQTFAMSASVGVALQDSADQPVDVLLRNADLAMYEAKQQGKARSATYRRHFHSRAVARFDMRSELSGALERDELCLHYQPIVDLVYGGIVGIEALLRWEHPSRGTIAPGKFLPLAEETGLIVPIGSWALHEACRQTVVWQDTPELGDVGISVNVSGRQLDHPGFDDTVAEALDATGLDARSLTVEITETAPLHLLHRDAHDVIHTLSAIQSTGVRLAVDDFGIGYSSLARLEILPVEEIKIDRSFVGRIEHRGPNSVLHGLLGLADAMGLEATVEGVETQEQADVLTELGYRRAQGFLFARPMPADDVLAAAASFAQPARR